MKFNKDDWFVRHEDGTKHFVISYQWLSYLLIAVVGLLIAWTLMLIEEHRLWGYFAVFFIGWGLGRFDQRWSDRRKRVQS